MEIRPLGNETYPGFVNRTQGKTISFRSKMNEKQRVFMFGTIVRIKLGDNTMFSLLSTSIADLMAFI